MSIGERAYLKERTIHGETLEFSSSTRLNTRGQHCQGLRRRCRSTPGECLRTSELRTPESRARSFATGEPHLSDALVHHQAWEFLLGR